MCLCRGPEGKKHLKKHTKSEHPFQKSIKKHCDRDGTDDFERVFASAPKRFSKTSEPLRFASKKCFKKRRFFEQKLAKYFAPSAVRTFLGTLRKVPKWWPKLKKKNTWRTPKSTYVRQFFWTPILPNEQQIVNSFAPSAVRTLFGTLLNVSKRWPKLNRNRTWRTQKSTYFR